MNRLLLLILNTGTLAAVIVLNIIAGFGIINNNDVGEVSRKYDTLFAPAGYAFSIWGLIYLLLIAFAGFQWFCYIKKRNIDVIDNTGIYFLIANIANMTWLFLWLNEQIGWSVMAMVVLLLALIVLVLRLRMELPDVTFRIIAFTWWPIAIYLGWIIVATVANIAAFFVSIGWEGSPLSPEMWTIIMIAVASIIYLLLIYIRNLREAALVGAWALIAIAIRQAAENPEISIAAGVGALLLFSAVAYHGYINRYFAPDKKLKRGEI